jgi:hypothetical protein
VARWPGNSTSDVNIGRFYSSAPLHYNGYLADFHFIDGQALDPTSFGEFDTNGVWQPIDASGLTYGTNGFHLPFSDNSTAAALGTDTSGNGNDWTFGNTIYVTQEISVNGGTYQLGGGAYGTAWYDLSAFVTGGSISSLTTRTTRNSSAIFPPFFVHAIEVNGVILIDYRLEAGNDSLVDSPTNYGEDTGAGGEVRGNYCTLNPLAKTYGTLPTIANGNLDVGPNNSGGNVLGTVAISSGKWYWEITVNTVGTALIGAASIEAALTTNQPGYIANSAAYLRDGRVKNNGSDVGTYASYTTGDVIGVALNMDVGAISFYKNNTLIVTISSNISGTWIPAVADYSATGSVIAANFGQRPFTYTAPSGFKALCTTNLPEPTIADGSTAMDVDVDRQWRWVAFIYRLELQPGPCVGKNKKRRLYTRSLGLR